MGSELKKNGYFYMILQFENFHLVPIYWHRTIKGYDPITSEPKYEPVTIFSI